VTKRCEFAAQVVCADAGLHADQNGGRLSIQTHNVKRILADIDTGDIGEVPTELCARWKEERA
jgi:hypothetical protein